MDLLFWSVRRYGSGREDIIVGCVVWGEGRGGAVYVLRLQHSPCALGKALDQSHRALLVAWIDHSTGDTALCLLLERGGTGLL